MKLYEYAPYIVFGLFIVMAAAFSEVERKELEELCLPRFGVDVKGECSRESAKCYDTCRMLNLSYFTWESHEFTRKCWCIGRDSELVLVPVVG